MDSREELMQITKALKSHVKAEKESKGHCYRMYANGAQQSKAEIISFAENDMPCDARVLTLEEIREELGDCRRCELHTHRRNLVFGEGNPKARLVFVGEAPGENEDRIGKPFVGRAGQLLTKIIEAMGLTRADVYICNILKCRPPGNRNPKEEEITLCEPFLVKQLKTIKPEIICALGTFAAKTLLKSDMPISQLRGKFHSYQGIDLMPTYHPAYLLRNPGAKKLVWKDVQMIMEKLR